MLWTPPLLEATAPAAASSTGTTVRLEEIMAKLEEVGVLVEKGFGRMRGFVKGRRFSLM